MKTLRVATCQFPVEADPRSNLGHILQQMEEAAKQKADLAHFSECALTGYAGVEFEKISQLDWPAIREAAEKIQAAARKLKLWVLLGSSHFIADDVPPHNSVYVIDSKGKIVDRYDKRFCTGCEGKKARLDLAHYTPGDHWTTFKIKGITCGVAICFDYRFPELARAYKALGTQVMFYSFHNARKTVVDDPKYNIWKAIVPATMQCRAAENHFWISANNSTAKPSMWGSFAVQPDGAIVGQLKVHKTGVLITDMHMDPALFDASAGWREAAMAGTLNTGTLVKHPRSAARTEL
jgi:predicted amidohydrolase